LGMIKPQRRRIGTVLRAVIPHLALGLVVTVLARVLQYIGWLPFSPDSASHKAGESAIGVGR
jgi:hypothetical protein